MKKFLIVTLILVAIFAILSYFGALPFFSCETEECFTNALKECKPISYEKFQNSNLYSYKIYRSFGSKCKFKVTLERMAVGADMDLIALLEDKSMVCNVPKTETDAIEKIERLLNYCHGELKEGLQQVLIQRIYGLLMKDMSGILEKAGI